MTAHSADDEEIVSAEDFEAALGGLVLTALESDINPHGSWVYHTNDGETDVEVMVFELDEKSVGE